MSLKAHIHEFREMLLESPFYHVFGVAESRLGPGVDDHIVSIDGYSCIRQDRNTEGGGIILYVRSTLKAKVLACSYICVSGKPLKPEYIMCSIWDDNSPPVFVFLVYRPPKIAFNADPIFVSNFRDLSSDFSHKIIMREFNADILTDEIFRV